jgi:hypothetical protein
VRTFSGDGDAERRVLATIPMQLSSTARPSQAEVRNRGTQLARQRLPRSHRRH